MHRDSPLGVQGLLKLMATYDHHRFSAGAASAPRNTVMS